MLNNIQPTNQLGSWFETSIFTTMKECLNINMRIFFKDICYIFPCKALSPCFWALRPSYPQGPNFGQNVIWTIWGCLHLNISIIIFNDLLLLRRIQKNISIHSNIKPWHLFVVPFYPGGHNVNTRESAPPVNDYFLMWLMMIPWYNSRIPMYWHVNVDALYWSRTTLSPCVEGALYEQTWTCAMSESKGF